MNANHLILQILKNNDFEVEILDIDTGHQLPIGPDQARVIGGRYGLISAGVGLGVAYFTGFWFSLSSFDFISSVLWFKIHLSESLVGSTSFLIVSYSLAREAGVLIIVQKVRGVLVGMITGICVLFFSGLLGGLTHHIIYDNDYISSARSILGPVILAIALTVVGRIPALIVGAWVGERLEQHAKRNYPPV